MIDENQNPANPPAGDSNPTPPPAQPTEPIAPTVEPAPAPEPIPASMPTQIPIVETEPVVAPTPESVPVPTPVEPAPPQPEPTPTPIAPDPVTAIVKPIEKIVENPVETVAAAAINPIGTASEIIMGAPTKPGDKPEKPEVEAVAKAASGLAAALKNSQSQNAGPNYKTGFRPDGTTPLDAEEKIFAGVGYISFLCFLPLLARRDSEFAQHHARQATVIFLIFLFLWIVGQIFSITGFIAFLQIIEFIVGFVIAYKGDWFRVPLIYNLSLKLKKPEVVPAQPQNPNPTANLDEEEADIDQDDDD
ncbi:MAG: hypothetical protein V2A63_03195 [Patescibacteria group bacterium]